MSSSTKTILSKKEFEAFLLIYAAHVDYEFSEDEKNFILERCSTEVFNKMHDLFMNTSDYMSMKLIIDHKPLYYQKEQARDNIFNLLKEIFAIDGDYSRIEKVFIQYFERIIEV